MNINPILGLAASLAGQSLAERKSTEGQEAAQNAGAERVAANEYKAEAAAGLGALDAEDQQANDRDADGRQVLSWGGGDEGKPKQDEHGVRQACSVDPHGDRGGSVDLLA